MDAKHIEHDGDPRYLLALNRDPRSGEVTGVRECFIGAGGCETWRFEHDARGQLTRAEPDHGASFSYAYDASGQRTRRSHGALEEVTQLADAQDRLHGYGGASFGYNAMGQRVAAVDTPTGDWTYDYDVNGGLRQVDGDNVRVEYVLDSAGRRIARRENDGPLTWWMQPQSSYAGPHPVAEFDAELRLRKRFFYGVEGHVPEYMTVHDAEGAETGRYQFVTNLVGSVVGVLDDNGEWVERTNYTPFGRPEVVIAAPEALRHPFGFAGGIKDEATGLVRFGARDYDPFTGVWLAKDPIGFAGGDANLYGYVGNDPVRFFDPSGLLEVQAGVDFNCVGIGCWATVGPDPEMAAVMLSIAALHPALRIVRGGVAILRLAWKAIQRRKAEERRGGDTPACPEQALLDDVQSENPVIGRPRVGSALKNDPHHAFPDMLDNYASDAQRFSIPTRGAGGEIVRQSDLYQLEGSLNGKSGVYEWIVDQEQVTHRRFIRRGVITGSPNQRPSR